LLIAAIVTAILLIGRRRRQRALERWRRDTARLVDSAGFARSLVPAEVTTIQDPERWRSLSEQIEHVAVSFDESGVDAPTTETKAAARDAAVALRALVDAVDAERSLRDRVPGATPEQIDEAAGVSRRRAREVDAALERLENLVGPPAGAPEGGPQETT
jgi:hypothetical protein